MYICISWIFIRIEIQPHKSSIHVQIVTLDVVVIPYEILVFLSNALQQRSIKVSVHHTIPLARRCVARYCRNWYWKVCILNTFKPVLAITSIKQPTCLKQPNKMFPNVIFVLIFTSILKAATCLKQPLCVLPLCGCLKQVWLYITLDHTSTRVYVYII